MDSSENSNWIFDCGLINDIPITGGDFPAPATGFYWPSQGVDVVNNASVHIDCPSEVPGSDGPKTLGSRKRQRSDSGNGSGSKACREKLRRDILNDRFLELAALMEPGKQPKMDKAAILNDAIRLVGQLQSEGQKMKELNENFQLKIKELKAEKHELREEKQRLRAEKEQLEQQLKNMIAAPPNFVPHPAAIPAAFVAQGQAAGNKMMPFISFPGVAMWQLMPPASVDTSQDHVLHPPVA
ncbi:transcription factor ILR3-like [Aristolochia californica]|uniref:transcription factor ILR3-like n=1 Tax=Aristolochia californica TaxID=171875 RepID=UPI0035DA3834